MQGGYDVFLFWTTYPPVRGRVIINQNEPEKAADTADTSCKRGERSSESSFLSFFRKWALNYGTMIGLFKCCKDSLELPHTSCPASSMLAS